MPNLPDQSSAASEGAAGLVNSAYDELCVRFSGVHSDDAMDSVLLRLHAALKKLGVDPTAPYIAPGMDDLRSSHIMGAARLHTHDHEMAYKITRDVIAALDSITDAAQGSVDSGKAAFRDPANFKEMADQLRYAAQTAQNDDLSEPKTDKRMRHINRVNIILTAAEEFDLLAAQPPAAPVESATKSAPVFLPPRNTGERLPSSDAAGAGAGTFPRWCPGCSCDVDGVCSYFQCAVGPNGLDAQLRLSAGNADEALILADKVEAFTPASRSFTLISRERRLVVDALRHFAGATNVLTSDQPQTAPLSREELRKIIDDASGGFNPMRNAVTDAILASCSVTRPHSVRGDK
jgi:hypothetical protein